MFRWLRRDPKHLKERRQSMLGALVDYPPYGPPHRQGPNGPRRLPQQSEAEYKVLLNRFLERGHENLSYFLAHRDARMTALSAFLAKFDVKMGFDDAGLAAVAAWCPGNAGSLGADLTSQKARQTFYQALRPWTEQWHGLNVIFDLGIFLGESLIARNPRLHWVYRWGTSDDGVSYHSGYDIGGFKRVKDALDPMGFIYLRCEVDEEGLRTGKTILSASPDLLIGTVRDYSTR